MEGNESVRTGSPAVTPAMLDSIATILKDESTLGEIDRFFQLADVDESWYPQDIRDQVRSRRDRTMGWFRAVQQNAPDQLLRVAISVAEQTSDKGLGYETHRNSIPRILSRLNQLAIDQANTAHEITNPDTVARNRQTIFVGHGSNLAWGQFVLHLDHSWDARIVYFEEENRTAQQNTDVINTMTAESTVAIILMTGDDTMADGSRRARQNVIHEAGISHGRLGFDKVALLIEDDVERFSNIDGVQYIQYNPNRVTDCLHLVGGFLERCGIPRRQA